MYETANARAESNLYPRGLESVYHFAKKHGGGLLPPRSSEGKGASTGFRIRLQRA